MRDASPSISSWSLAILHLPRREVRGTEARARQLRRIGASLLSLFDFPLILDENAAGAARRSHAVITHITFDCIRFSGPGMLDGRQKPLAAAQQGHGGAGRVTRFVAQEIGGIFAPRLSRQTVLRSAIEDAWACEAQAACSNIRAFAEAGTPVSALDNLVWMGYLAGKVIWKDLVDGVWSLRIGWKCGTSDGRRTGRLQRIGIWRNRERLKRQRLLMFFDW
jgi:hypothetical protein